MTALNELKKKLRAGQVYRRADLARWSNAVDRHARALVEEGRLVKVSGGLYQAPKKTRFGDAPADPMKLVERFLKDDRFLMVSPNAYNALGVGVTQLYNETIVYNAKRHGLFELDGRSFDFRVKPHFPAMISEEYLLVDLVDNLDRLAEDQDAVLQHVMKRAERMDLKALEKTVRNFGGRSAKRVFEPLVGDPDLRMAA